jgi:hypothetical protein
MMVEMDKISSSGGSIKFFKLECNDELKERNKIIKVEFSRFATCVLN